MWSLAADVSVEASAPSDLLDCDPIAKAFERDLAWWRSGRCASSGGGRCAGEDASAVSVRSDSRGFMYAETGEVVAAHERVGLVDADTDLRYEVGDVALLGETLLDRDGTVDGVRRIREGREEPIAAATLSHLHALMLGEEFADRQIVIMHDPRPGFVASLRNESRGVDDVGEHEGAPNRPSDRGGAEPVTKALSLVEVANGAEVLERGDRGVDLDDRDLTVIEPRSRFRDETLRLRGLVGSAHVAPEVDGSACCSKRRRVGSVRQCHLCRARRGARLQDDRLEDCGDVGQAFCRETCRR